MAIVDQLQTIFSGLENQSKQLQFTKGLLKMIEQYQQTQKFLNGQISNLIAQNQYQKSKFYTLSLSFQHFQIAMIEIIRKHNKELAICKKLYEQAIKRTNQQQMNELKDKHQNQKLQQKESLTKQFQTKQKSIIQRFQDELKQKVKKITSTQSKLDHSNKKIENIQIIANEMQLSQNQTNSKIQVIENKLIENFFHEAKKNKIRIKLLEEQELEFEKIMIFISNNQQKYQNQIHRILSKELSLLKNKKDQCEENSSISQKLNDPQSESIFRLSQESKTINEMITIIKSSQSYLQPNKFIIAEENLKTLKKKQEKIKDLSELIQINNKQEQKLRNIIKQRQQRIKDMQNEKQKQKQKRDEQQRKHLEKIELLTKSHLHLESIYNKNLDISSILINKINTILKTIQESTIYKINNIKLTIRQKGKYEDKLFQINDMEEEKHMDKTYKKISLTQKDKQQQLWDQRLKCIQVNNQEIVKEISRREVNQIQTSKLNKQNQIRIIKQINKTQQLNIQKQSLQKIITQKKCPDIIDSQEKFIFHTQIHSNEINWIKKQIESLTKKKINGSKMLFKKCSLNPHFFIDNIPNILLIIYLQNGQRIGGFSQNAFIKPVTERPGSGIIFNASKKKSYQLKYGDEKARSITYDDYYIIFGNSEIRIRNNEHLVFSNFGIVNSYYDNGIDKSVDFLDSKSKQLLAVNYQYLEVRFEGENFVERDWMIEK